MGGGFTSGPSCDAPRNTDTRDYTMICAGRGKDGAVWVSRLLK